MKHTYLIRNENNPESDAVKVEARSFYKALRENLGDGVWELVQYGRKTQRWQTWYGKQLPDGSYPHSDVFIVTKLS